MKGHLCVGGPLDGKILPRPHHSRYLGVPALGAQGLGEVRYTAHQIVTHLGDSSCRWLVYVLDGHAPQADLVAARLFSEGIEPEHSE